MKVHLNCWVFLAWISLACRNIMKREKAGRSYRTETLKSNFEPINLLNFSLYYKMLLYCRIDSNEARTALSPSVM